MGADSELVTSLEGVASEGAGEGAVSIAGVASAAGVGVAVATGVASDAGVAAAVAVGIGSLRSFFCTVVFPEFAFAVMMESKRVMAKKAMPIQVVKRASTLVV